MESGLRPKIHLRLAGGSGTIVLMEITTERKPLEQVEADALIVPVLEGAKETRFGAGELCDSGEIAGKPLEFTLLHHAPGSAAKRVLLVGAGKAEKFNAAEMRKLAGAAVRYLKPKGIKRIAIALSGSYAGADFASAAVEGAILGDYEPDRYKTKGDKHALEAVVIAGGEQTAVDRGRMLAEAQNFARAMANEPANLLTPLKM